MIRRPCGLSLVETVFSFTILVLVILFSMSLAPSSLLTLARSHHQIQAATLAQSHLDQQRTRLWDSLSSGTLSPYTLDDGLVLNPELEVEPINPRAKRVRVTVRWKERETKVSVFREVVMAKVNR